MADDHGGPALDDPGHHLDDDLLAAARQYRWLLTWAIQGQQTGHRWAPCDQCDQLALVRLDGSRTSRACILTPGCAGRHRCTPTPRRRTP